ncbi:UNVERIFIED_CONTAM: hypothetical protein GTU68_049486 [Idotea baltica]|nr:hypothetical protein [Idotea baltica]
MQINTLFSISPIDGRYQNKTAELVPYFSEFGLIKYRVQVEVEYFIALYEYGLPQLQNIDSSVIEQLTSIYENFNLKDAEAIKATEKITNHDVKAVEYFVKDKLRALGIDKEVEFVHFGLTSQDINNTAVPLSIKEAIVQVLLPLFESLAMSFSELSTEWVDIPMLARTHGQPASPTLLGKEINVFTARFVNQLIALSEVPISAKFGGATGNMNAHYVAYPENDWHAFAQKFVELKLGLMRSYPTTQIEHYDDMAALCHAFMRINTVLIDFCRDMWAYISMDYFKQKIKAGEVGSSAMPHKVNPIDFENAEGNLGVANAIFGHLAAKLPISRLQRDLTDSTVLRNIGVPLAHTLIAIKAIEKGMSKLLLNQTAINADLESNWAVIAEAIQTILRREGYPKPYEALKALTRTNAEINQKSMHSFIDTLEVSNEIKTELKTITPSNYVGRAMEFELDDE